MKKQLGIIGIVALLISVWLSGCDDHTFENRTEIPISESDFRTKNPTTENNCGTTTADIGKIHVNFTVINHGMARWTSVWA
jgi:hypothetical protein